MKEEISFKEFKERELLGDALLDFLVIHIMISEFSNHKRSLPSTVKHSFVRNDILNMIAQNIGLEPHIEDLSPKRYANSFEARVYELFVANGINNTRQFIKDNLILPVLDKYNNGETLLNLSMPKLTKEEWDEFKKGLPKGWAKTVQQRTKSKKLPKGYSEGMIYRVMRGDKQANSEVIISECIALKYEEEGRKKRFENHLINAIK